MNQTTTVTESAETLSPVVVDLAAAAVIANRMGPPVWLALVGGEGSAVIDSLKGLRGVVSFDGVTPGAFDEVAKKLKPGCTCLLKEISPRRRTTGQKKVVARLLAEIEEGTGIVAAATARDENPLGSLGDRFLLWKMREGEADQEIMTYEDSIPVPADVAFSDDVETYLGLLGAFLARARAPVRRDSYSRDIVEMPEVDPTGLTARLAQLLRGLTAVRGLPEPYDAEVRVIERVVLSTVPPARLRVIQTLPFYGVRVREMADYLRLPRSVVHRVLEDLELLGLVGRHERLGYMPHPDHQLFFRLARA